MPNHDRATNGAPLAFPEIFRDEVFRIETRRLWLRWPAPADAPALHEIASLEAVARQTATWPHPFPEGEALRRIERARAANASGADLQLAIAEKTRPGRLIGLIGVHRDAHGDGLGIGYMLGIEHQGYGIMTEAARSLVAMVFRFTPYNAIRGASRTANIGSRRVMEKAGFHPLGQIEHEAPARGKAVTADALELTRQDWLGRASLRSTLPTLERASDLPCGCAA